MPGMARREGNGGLLYTARLAVSPSALITDAVMFEISPASHLPKAAQYEELVAQARALLAGETDWIANAANFSAFVFHSLSDLNWAGFYFHDGRELVVGPFQGKPACVRIALGKGVCGTAAQTRQTQVVRDVHEFPGHIACDSASQSEIVVPLVAPDGTLIGRIRIPEVVSNVEFGGAKRNRLYITATQSLNDYYKSDGARAALENSDWMLVLQQKAETIADFRKEARLEMDDRTETLIRSLKRSGSDYSEVFIKGPETEAIGRLVLDDYSATLFSSSPQTFAAIDAEIARGHQLADAIERIAHPNR